MSGQWDSVPCLFKCTCGSWPFTAMGLGKGLTHTRLSHYQLNSNKSQLGSLLCAPQAFINTFQKLPSLSICRASWVESHRLPGLSVQCRCKQELLIFRDGACDKRPGRCACRLIRGPDSCCPWLSHGASWHPVTYAHVRSCAVPSGSIPASSRIQVWTSGSTL